MTIARRLILALLLTILRAGVAPAQPILEAAAVPLLNAAGQTGYGNFLLTNLPRAFALSSKGQYGWFGGSGTIDQARAKALASCAEKGGADCALYAENLDIVWKGRALAANPVPPALVSTMNYSIDPDARYFWRGPAAAAGVYVWGHGFGAMNGNGGVNDARGAQPQTHVRAFNNAGFDIVRFDRHPNADADKTRAAGWLEESLRDLRKRGYRKIVVGGQSRGGWNALQMLTRPGLADAIVAVAAAAHGSGGSTNLSAQYDDLRSLVGEVPRSAARLVFVQFAADPYAGDLDGRAKLVERLRPNLGGLLLIDRPDGFAGHFGGQQSAFAQRFAPCILRFVTDPVPKPAC